MLYTEENRKIRLRFIYNIEPERDLCVTTLLRTVKRSDFGFGERASYKCPLFGTYLVH